MESFFLDKISKLNFSMNNYVNERLIEGVSNVLIQFNRRSLNKYDKINESLMEKIPDIDNLLKDKTYQFITVAFEEYGNNFSELCQLINDLKYFNTNYKKVLCISSSSCGARDLAVEISLNMNCEFVGGLVGLSSSINHIYIGPETEIDVYSPKMLLSQLAQDKKLLDNYQYVLLDLFDSNEDFYRQSLILLFLEHCQFVFVSFSNDDSKVIERLTQMKFFFNILRIENHFSFYSISSD